MFFRFPRHRATADQIQRISAPHLTFRHADKETPSKQKQARTASHPMTVNEAVLALLCLKPHMAKLAALLTRCSRPAAGRPALLAAPGLGGRPGSPEPDDLLHYGQQEERRGV